MSFILDALKKLEHKQKKGSIPDLTTVHEPAPMETGRRRFWPLLLLAALFLNAAILLIWLGPWKGDKTPEGTRPAAEQHDDAPQTSSQNGIIEKTPAASKTVSEQPVPVIPEAGISAHKTPAEPDTEISEDARTPVPEAGVSAHKAIIEPDTEISEDARTPETIEPQQMPSQAEPADSFPPVGTTAAGSGNEIPDREELSLSVRENLPDILIAGHIYSNDSSSRLININGNIIREGQTVAKGLKLVEITPSGAIFSFQGHIFRIKSF
jgi:general secretion pathway protein B